MAQNQTLVPNLREKVWLIIALIVLSVVGIFERRTKVVLKDGSVVTGKVLDEEGKSDANTLVLLRPSGREMKIPRAGIASETWLHVEPDINLGLDLKGGTQLRYRIDLKALPESERAGTLARAVETFNARLDSLGVRELSIQSFGSDEIVIELPGVTMEESEAYELVVQSLGRLEYRIVAESRPGVFEKSEIQQQIRDHLKQLTDSGVAWTPRAVDLSQFDRVAEGGIIYRWFPYSEKAIAQNPGIYSEFPFEALELNPAETFTGEDIESTFPSIDQRGFSALGFSMKASRGSAFGDFTEKYQGRQMAILLDNEINSAPTLNSRIETSGIIEGGTDGFQANELKTLRTTLSSGSLRVKPEKMSKATIGPTLGEASIRRGIVAGILASIGILGFVWFYYRVTGAIACATLVLGIFLLIGGLGFIEATLTLPGIAGIVLTVGMAVDQNILILERFREEREKGKTLAQAVKNGFDRAFVTIFDAQATTFLTGAILYYYGTGPIRGFAVTLMLGIATTMFAAIVGSKVLFAFGLNRGWFDDLSMRRLIGTPNIQFTRYMKACIIASSLCIGSGLIVFGMKYREIEGLDFAGGFQAHVVLKEAKTQPEIEALIGSRHQNARIVSMRGIEGATGAAEGIRDYLITIPTDPNEVARSTADGDAEVQRDRYLSDLVEVLGPLMLPEAIANIAVSSDPATQKTTARFTLNFAADIAPEVVEGRLKQRFASATIEPAAAGAAARSFAGTVTYASAVTPERVRAEVASTLADLPGGVRLSDPIPESQFIGSKVGKELTNKAIIAIVLSIIGILIYVRIRFREFSWGIAACVALVHDVLFCLAALAVAHVLGIVNVELDLTAIGTFLTVVGFSLNDTIVIFDRVRENLPRMKRPLSEVIDYSVNQTLSRTILTSYTVFLAVLVMFGVNYGQNNVIEGFAFVMLVGTLAGCYSTVFIAAPMLLWLEKRSNAPSGPDAARSVGALPKSAGATS